MHCEGPRLGYNAQQVLVGRGLSCKLIFCVEGPRDRGKHRDKLGQRLVSKEQRGNHDSGAGTGSRGWGVVGGPEKSEGKVFTVSKQHRLTYSSFFLFKDTH